MKMGNKENRVDKEAVETYLMQCRLLLSQLENNDNLTDTEVSSRYRILDFILDKVDKHTGVSSKEEFNRFLDHFKIDTSKSLTEEDLEKLHKIGE
jgi:hypothetical protein